MHPPLFYTQINEYIIRAGEDIVIQQWDDHCIYSATGEKLTRQHLDDVLEYNKHLKMIIEREKLNDRKQIAMENAHRGDIEFYDACNNTRNDEDF